MVFSSNMFSNPVILQKKLNSRQLELLVEHLYTNKELARANSEEPQSARMWHKITDELNAMGCVKTTKEWQQNWSYWCQKAKSKVKTLQQSSTVSKVVSDDAFSYMELMVLEILGINLRNEPVNDSIATPTSPTTEDCGPDVISCNDGAVSLVCRLCLSTKGLVQLFDCNVSAKSETLKLATGLEIKMDDGLPQLVCYSCSSLLASAIKLRQQSNAAAIWLLKSHSKTCMKAPVEKPEPTIKGNLENELEKNRPMVIDVNLTVVSELNPKSSQLNKIAVKSPNQLSTNKPNIVMTNYENSEKNKTTQLSDNQLNTSMTKSTNLTDREGVGEVSFEPSDVRFNIFTAIPGRVQTTVLNEPTLAIDTLARCVDGNTDEDPLKEVYSLPIWKEETDEETETTARIDESPTAEKDDTAKRKDRHDNDSEKSTVESVHDYVMLETLDDDTNASGEGIANTLDDEQFDDNYQQKLINHDTHDISLSETEDEDGIDSGLETTNISYKETKCKDQNYDEIVTISATDKTVSEDCSIDQVTVTTVGHSLAVKTKADFGEKNDSSAVKRGKTSTKSNYYKWDTSTKQLKPILQLEFEALREYCHVVKRSQPTNNLGIIATNRCEPINISEPGQTRVKEKIIGRGLKIEEFKISTSCEQLTHGTHNKNTTTKLHDRGDQRAIGIAHTNSKHIENNTSKRSRKIDDRMPSYQDKNETIDPNRQIRQSKTRKNIVKDKSNDPKPIFPSVSADDDMFSATYEEDCDFFADDEPPIKIAKTDAKRITLGPPSSDNIFSNKLKKSPDPPESIGQTSNKRRQLVSHVNQLSYIAPQYKAKQDGGSEINFTENKTRSKLLEERDVRQFVHESIFDPDSYRGVWKCGCCNHTTKSFQLFMIHCTLHLERKIVCEEHVESCHNAYMSEDNIVRRKRDCSAAQKKLNAIKASRRLLRDLSDPFQLPEEEFLERFHLTLEAYKQVLSEIEPHLPKLQRITGVRNELKLLAALSFYVEGSFHRSLGNLGMAQVTFSKCLKEVTNALNSQEILQRHIKFPATKAERAEIMESFMAKFKFPGTVGCIGATQVPIACPNERKEYYLNDNGYHSLNTLIICDASLRILHIDATFGGVVTDAYVWNQSPIKYLMAELHKNGERCWLVGDSSYPQQPWLLAPAADAAPDSPEAFYNKCHSSVKNTVERCILSLKARWQSLFSHHCPLRYTPDRATKIVNACAVLHNIANAHNIPVPELKEEDIEAERRRQVHAPSYGRGLNYDWIPLEEVAQQLWAERQ